MKYDIIVFVKFEKQTSGAIMKMYPIILDPSFVIELKISAKMTNGKEKIKSSFIVKLIA
jgi:hypothetical protein